MVQGFFFQERQHLGIGYRPGDGAIAVVSQALMRDMFSGVFGPAADFRQGWVGWMMDPAGSSTLSNVSLSDTEFRFDKRYDHRDFDIHYEFRREGDLWIGQYYSDAVGSGAANCIVTPVSERVFSP
jgi:hypothetical protein